MSLVDAWHQAERTLNYYVVELEDLANNYYLQLRAYTIDTVEHLILAFSLYIVLCILLYVLMVRLRWPCFDKSIENEGRVLIVTAHPDDECMFFGPTVLNLVQRKGCTVYLMCFSTGKNYGMGAVRKKELYEACKILGIQEENIVVQSHSNLPDSMDVRWPSEVLEKILLNFIEQFDISSVITFDRHGVSQHKNHCSLYYCIANIILEKKLPNYCRVFVLESVNIIRKYWLILDIPLSLLLSRYRYIASSAERNIIHKSMKQHQSQLLWFRKVYMYISRYMLINTLEEVNLSDVELDISLEE